MIHAFVYQAARDRLSRWWAGVPAVQEPPEADCFAELADLDQLEEPEPPHVTAWEPTADEIGNSPEWGVLDDLAALSEECSPWEAARLMFAPGESGSGALGAGDGAGGDAATRASEAPQSVSGRSSVRR
ncbi:hypothetical protein [Nonomuraea sp. NPDC003804]|uniref:hypothetical protein n=1 Tax=Nonomuraea sp. NPDC003804 TaxID=3154547 RepID=UPI0033B5CCE6